VNTRNILTDTIYGQMFVPETDTGVGLALHLAGEFCYDEQRHIEKYITEDAIVLDVGANLGVFSLFAARHMPVLHLEGDKTDSPLTQWLRSRSYRLFHERVPIVRERNFKGSAIAMSEENMQHNFIAIPPHIRDYPALEEF
jgi:hypothetical protein